MTFLKSKNTEKKTVESAEKVEQERILTAEGWRRRAVKKQAKGK
jgi:hypothetical protein